MAIRDGDGYIHLIDRKKNMIISGGENIYPSEVEAVLGARPKVKDVAMIGLPDDEMGRAVHGVVVLHAGARRPSASCSTGAGQDRRLQKRRALILPGARRTCPHRDRQVLHRVLKTN